MEFHLNKDTKPILILKANDTDLADRWILHNPGYFMDIKVNNSISSFVKSKPGDRKLRRTRLSLCEDSLIERTVLAKTVSYERNDLNNENNIKLRRRSLYEQVYILNKISSNMLPEPLDFFEITNDYDEFSGTNAKELKKSEPVLILDYIPGDVLGDKLQSTWDKLFYRIEDRKDFQKNTESINVGAVMRLVGDILAFESDLYDKGYAYTALSPDHIVLLGDNKPRFIGISRICPIIADRYDYNHINYGRQLKGYSAPEFNQKETNYGMQASVKAAIAYNLGVLIAAIILGRTEFDEKSMVKGAYDYFNTAADREAVKRAWNGVLLDNLICRLTNYEPSKRLTNFSAILQEFAIISGDAVNESKKDPIYFGTVKFFAPEKGFGFVTSGEKDYYVPLSRLKNVPSGEEGQSVSFTIERDQKGKDIVKAFVNPPKTRIEYPRFVKKKEPVVQPIRPQPIPQPMPRPTQQPQPTLRPKTPEKKGFFKRLFGL